MRALIIGIRGQDGTFLKKILVRNEYDVFGVLRPGAHMGSNWQNDVTQSITKKQLEKDIRIDLADSNLCNEYLNLIKPDRIFHLAAEHAPASEMASVENNKSKEMYKCHVTLTQNLLEWVKLHTKTRLVVALTSQMYSPSLFQNKITEKNIYAPQNLYSKTKLEGFNLLKKYRQEYGLFANGLILFNHTSAIAKPTYLFRFFVLDGRLFIM
jgi:GDPmannose 4,6-dehydratase